MEAPELMLLAPAVSLAICPLATGAATFSPEDQVACWRTMRRRSVAPPIARNKKDREEKRMNTGKTSTIWVLIYLAATPSTVHACSVVSTAFSNTTIASSERFRFTPPSSPRMWPSLSRTLYRFIERSDSLTEGADSATLRASRIAPSARSRWPFGRKELAKILRPPAKDCWEEGIGRANSTAWPVSDSVTREMMTAFYAGLKQGLGRAESLRKAQLAMLKRKGREHPFYWASFIQSGEWGNLAGRR